MIAVADNGRARFFGTDESLSQLAEVSDLIHPSSRLKGEQVHSDAKGRFGTHTPQARLDWKKTEAAVFSREVSAEAIRLMENYDSAVVVAAPTFLGHLRANMPEALERVVVHSVSRNLTGMTNLDLQVALTGYLADVDLKNHNNGH
jgi:protein required for attachment to host cells